MADTREALDEFTPSGLQTFLEEATWRETFAISDRQIEQLVCYADLLVETNKHMNLTGITDIKGIAQRHILDSLTVLPALDREIARSGKQACDFCVADEGTGAGLPAVILKIMRPDIELYMIDSLAKRIRFLETVSDRLSFTRVHALHLRAEEAGRSSELRDQIDFVTARAVAELRVLAEYCLPLVRPGGTFLAMKAKADVEVVDAKHAIQVLAARTETVEDLLLPTTSYERQLITFRKIGNTPKAYPRPAGKLQKKPL